MKVKYQIYLKLLKSALFSKMETHPSSPITIYVLPSFSKIFKTIVCNRLMRSLISHYHICIAKLFENIPEICI